MKFIAMPNPVSNRSKDTVHISARFTSCSIAGASVLDVGCGAGLFILLMARLGRIRSAVGFDTDYDAIHAAQDAAAKLLNRGPIHFEQHSADDWWPKGCFDVVDNRRDAPRAAREAGGLDRGCC
jgi:2-polyprenyl-3-methyl-5-hydroxy-6-metoxy-1,4-benzoquinol methylase